MLFCVRRLPRSVVHPHSYSRRFSVVVAFVDRIPPLPIPLTTIDLSQSPRYDADKVVDKLRKQLGRGGNFNWVVMGQEASVIFNCVPTSVVAFLSGPLQDGREEIGLKQRAKRRVQVDDDAEEERPEDVKGHTERGVDHLSAHDKNVDVVLKTLKRSIDKTYKNNKRVIEETFGDDIPPKAEKRMKKSKDVCAVNLLFNPQSFTQTVENMFHYSYLVKVGKAKLTVRNQEVDYNGVTLSERGPRAGYVKQGNQQLKHPPSRQAVVALTMKDWRDMVEAYNVEQSHVPHRTGSKMKKEVVYDDSDDDQEEED